jgi:GDPmannose 4,6-dehydratase
MTAIIFGANGQDGFYLKKLLEKQGCNVIGVSRTGGYLSIDITNYKEVTQLIEQYKPEYIFHLAANSTTRHDTLFENHTTISTGTITLLEAVKNISPQTKVFISGSGLQFVNNNVPIKETDAFEATSPYAVARIQSVYAARYFRKKFGLKIYVGYFFNHDSPRRTEQHVNQKIVRAVQRIMQEGSEEKLILGNIEVKKEFTYAGDIVEAVWKLVNQELVFEAVIGSGKAYRIGDWLAACFAIIKKNWKDYVVLKSDFIPEYEQLVSDPTLIFSLGWQPKVSLEELAKMMIYDSNYEDS